MYIYISIPFIFSFLFAFDWRLSIHTRIRCFSVGNWNDRRVIRLEMIPNEIAKLYSFFFFYRKRDINQMDRSNLECSIINESRIYIKRYALCMCVKPFALL